MSSRTLRHVSRLARSGIPWLLLAAATMLAGCYTGPGAEHYAAIIDSLDVPDGWQIAETEIRGPGQPERGSCDPMYNTGCPGVTRSFLVDTGVAEAYEEAIDAFAMNGFVATETSTQGCSAGSSNGPPCTFYAARGSDEVSVRVYAPGEWEGLWNLGLDDQGMVVVVVQASR